MIARAQLRYLGVSAQKTRLVVDQLRGRNVGDARVALQCSPKRVARDIAKVMQSAVANAQQHDPNVNVDDLFIARATVDDAPPMKRSRHQAMGRVFPVLKRACHITIGLDVRKRKQRQGGGS